MHDGGRGVVPGGDDVGGHVVAVHDGLAHVGVEPAVGDDEVAVLAGVLAPAVLHAPGEGLADGVEVHALERHGVVELGLACVEARCLVHAKGHAEKRLVVERLGVEQAGGVGAVHVLEHVAGHPRRVAGLELGDHGALEHVDRHVEHADGYAGDRSLVLKLQDGAVRACLTRDVAQVDEVGHAHAGVAGEELLRRHVLDTREVLGLPVLGLLGHKGLRRAGGGGVRAVCLGLLGLACVGHVLEGEACGRLAQAHCQDTVDVGQHGTLHLRELLGRGALGHGGPQLHGTLPQLAEEHLVHVGGRLGVGGVRHASLGHHAVLVDERRGGVPPAAVACGFLQPVHHLAVVDGLVGQADHFVEEGRALLELVPKLQVGLGKLKLRGSQRAHHAVAHHVERREQPAAAALALVGDVAGGREAHRVRVVVHAVGQGVLGRRPHARRGRRVARNRVGRKVPKRCMPLLDCAFRDAALIAHGSCLPFSIEIDRRYYRAISLALFVVEWLFTGRPT